MHVRHVDGLVRVGHNGITPGHTANMEFIPALKLGVVVCTNSNEGDPTAYVDYALQLLSPIVAKIDGECCAEARPGVEAL